MNGDLHGGEIWLDLAALYGAEGGTYASLVEKGSPLYPAVKGAKVEEYVDSRHAVRKLDAQAPFQRGEGVKALDDAMALEYGTTDPKELNDKGNEENKRKLKVMLKECVRTGARVTRVRGTRRARRCGTVASQPDSSAAAACSRSRAHRVLARAPQFDAAAPGRGHSDGAVRHAGRGGHTARVRDLRHSLAGGCGGHQHAARVAGEAELVRPCLPRWRSIRDAAR